MHQAKLQPALDLGTAAKTGDGGKNPGDHRISIIKHRPRLFQLDPFWGFMNQQGWLLATGRVGAHVGSETLQDLLQVIALIGSNRTSTCRRQSIVLKLAGFPNRPFSNIPLRKVVSAAHLLQ